MAGVTIDKSIKHLFRKERESTKKEQESKPNLFLVLIIREDMLLGLH